MRNEIHGQLLRIYIGEADTWEGKPLYQQIVERARKRELAGVTVTRGLQGFRSGAQVHRATALGIGRGTPVLIEVADSEEKLQGFIPELNAMVESGLVTLSESRLIWYRRTS